VRQNDLKFGVERMHVVNLIYYTLLPRILCSN